MQIKLKSVHRKKKKKKANRIYLKFYVNNFLTVVVGIGLM